MSIYPRLKNTFLRRRSFDLGLYDDHGIRYLSEEYLSEAEAHYEIYVRCLAASDTYVIEILL